MRAATHCSSTNAARASTVTSNATRDRRGSDEGRHGGDGDRSNGEQEPADLLGSHDGPGDDRHGDRHEHADRPQPRRGQSGEECGDCADAGGDAPSHSRVRRARARRARSPRSRVAAATITTGMAVPSAPTSTTIAAATGRSSRRTGRSSVRAKKDSTATMTAAIAASIAASIIELARECGHLPRRPLDDRDRRAHGAGKDEPDDEQGGDEGRGDPCGDDRSIAPLPSIEPHGHGDGDHGGEELVVERQVALSGHLPAEGCGGRAGDGACGGGECARGRERSTRRAVAAARRRRSRSR